MNMLLHLVAFAAPWPLKRRILSRFFGYTFAPGSKIDLSLVFSKEVILEEGASIGHFTIIKNLDRLVLNAHAQIGNFNWISDPSLKAGTPCFMTEKQRVSELRLEQHSAITHRHLIDCTNTVSIGAYTTLAGYRSQIITHGIDIGACRQGSAPVRIGDYCLVGTGCLILKGSVIADRILIGAGAVVATSLSDPCSLYAGVPAEKIKALPPDALYFQRTTGTVL